MILSFIITTDDEPPCQEAFGHLSTKWRIVHMALWHFGRSRTVAKNRLSFSSLRAMSAEALQAGLAGSPDEVAGLVAAAARHGLVEAQVLLGQMLLDGQGMARDPAAAFAWFSSAAAAGHGPAINMMGRCHELGWGVAVDHAAAAALYRRAAEGGLDWGQFNLANLLLRGLGVARSRKDALHWLRCAARQGHAKAMNLLGRFHEEGWEMPPDPAAALRWYREAATRGDFRAQFNLATILVQQGEVGQAAIWFHTALNARNPDILAAAQGLATRHEPALRDVAVRAAALLAVEPGRSPASQV
jgi:TPR repeat protein